MNFRETSVYILIALLVFIITSFPALFFSEPNLSEPASRPQFTSTAENNPSSSPVEFNLPDWLRTLSIVVLVGVLGLLIYFAIPYFSNIINKENRTPKKLEEDELIDRLLDARTQAYTILKDALITGSYTSSYIKAYQTLDDDLENFRNIYRPKYWTPKEYAFSVRPPIFRPAVYKFVSIFYDIRYGMSEATDTNILLFIEMLDNLFEADVPEQKKIELLSYFSEIIKHISVSKIPARQDPTKPKRR